MKLVSFIVLLVAVFLVPSFAEDTSEKLSGTWSGNWTRQDGIPEPMTIELAQESPGRLTGKFLTPVRMEFTHGSFDPKTDAITLEGMDQKSGKHYRIDGKIRGTELNGTLGIDGVKAALLLIKWTYFGR